MCFSLTYPWQQEEVFIWSKTQPPESLQDLRRSYNTCPDIFVLSNAAPPSGLFQLIDSYYSVFHHIFYVLLMIITQLFLDSIKKNVWRQKFKKFKSGIVPTFFLYAVASLWLDKHSTPFYFNNCKVCRDSLGDVHS